ncbi:MAG: hypothetical protein WKF71_15380 [Pyrinomonadaceae bacterium]
MQTQKSLDEFKNEPFVDYGQPENAEAMRQAIEQVKSELGREYPVIINGEKITLEKKFESVNPAEKSQVIGVFSDADADAEIARQPGDWFSNRSVSNLAECKTRRTRRISVPRRKHYS